jgi:hypothetical protein
MGERTVPAHVPRWTDANTMEGFKEGDRRHEVWAALLDFRDLAMIDSVAHMLRAGGEDTDLAGLLALLWNGFMDDDEAAEFVEEHRERIEARTRELEGNDERNEGPAQTEEMMEARLRRLSPEARGLFEEIERRKAEAAPGADAEELLGDVLERIEHLDERDRANLVEVLGRRVHGRGASVDRMRAEAEDLRHAALLAQHAAELEGVDADSMTIGRAVEVLERRGEPFPAGLAERLQGMNGG